MGQLYRFGTEIMETNSKALSEVVADVKSSAIKISSIPYGFFERELLRYFKQFGSVKRVRVARNPKTGNHRGWAFVLFSDKTVAQIAAETMDGYLIYNKRLRCKVLTQKEVPKFLKQGKCVRMRPVNKARAVKHAKLANEACGNKQSRKKLLQKLRKKKAELERLGLHYSFNLIKKFDSSGNDHILNEKSDAGEGDSLDSVHEDSGIVAVVEENRSVSSVRSTAELVSVGNDVAAKMVEKSPKNQPEKTTVPSAASKRASISCGYDEDKEIVKKSAKKQLKKKLKTKVSAVKAVKFSGKMKLTKEERSRTVARNKKFIPKKK